jgi:hypothetical protein
VERFSRRDVSAALGRRSRERGLNLELRGRLPLVRVVPPGRVRRRAPVLAHRARVHPITIPEGLCRDPRWEHRPSGRTRSCVRNPEPPSTPAGTAPGDAGIASAVQRPQLSRGHSERSFVTVIRVRPCRTGSVGRHGQIRTRVREWRRSPFGSTMRYMALRARERASERRGWDSNPRSRLPPMPVFKMCWSCRPPVAANGVSSGACPQMRHRIVRSVHPEKGRSARFSDHALADVRRVGARTAAGRSAVEPTVYGSGATTSGIDGLTRRPSPLGG